MGVGLKMSFIDITRGPSPLYEFLAVSQKAVCGLCNRSIRKCTCLGERLRTIILTQFGLALEWDGVLQSESELA